jgi:hypothetical protein
MLKNAWQHMYVNSCWKWFIIPLMNSCAQEQVSAQIQLVPCCISKVWVWCDQRVGFSERTHAWTKYMRSGLHWLLDSLFRYALIPFGVLIHPSIYALVVFLICRNGLCVHCRLAQRSATPRDLDDPKWSARTCPFVLRSHACGICPTAPTSRTQEIMSQQGASICTCCTCGGSIVLQKIWCTRLLM